MKTGAFCPSSLGKFFLKDSLQKGKKSIEKENETPRRAANRHAIVQSAVAATGAALLPVIIVFVVPTFISLCVFRQETGARDVAEIEIYPVIVIVPGIRPTFCSPMTTLWKTDYRITDAETRFHPGLNAKNLRRASQRHLENTVPLHAAGVHPLNF